MEEQGVWIILKSVMWVACGLFEALLLLQKLVSPSVLWLFSCTSTWLSFWLATAASFLFASSFSLVCTFLSENLPFSVAFLVYLLLVSPFIVPLSDLTFLPGPLAGAVKGESMVIASESPGYPRALPLPLFLLVIPLFASPVQRAIFVIKQLLILNLFRLREK